MDTTDPLIQFDESGICNHCQQYDIVSARFVPTGEIARSQLEKNIAEIKEAGKGKKYDCVIGISGGVDSTFTAYKVVQLGLRPLAVHLDNGWNSELAVKNIEHVLKKLKVDLYTHVIDWEEFKDLQVAFLKASTPDAEIPSDHAIVSINYSIAKRNRIKYVVLGCNYRTETHLPLAWSQGHADWKYINGIHKKFGNVPLKTFPRRNLFSYYFDSISIKRFDILNYVDYNKKQAMETLKNDLGWKYYGGKHYESIYTRFYQGYILPKKFGFDKRRAHLSSLICSGEISRDDALVELKEDTYPIALQNEDKEYVQKKFGITSEDFSRIMDTPPKTYWDYSSYGQMRKTILYKFIKRFFNAANEKN